MATGLAGINGLRRTRPVSPYALSPFPDNYGEWGGHEYDMNLPSYGAAEQPTGLVLVRLQTDLPNVFSKIWFCSIQLKRFGCTCILCKGGLAVHNGGKSLHFIIFA